MINHNPLSFSEKLVWVLKMAWRDGYASRKKLALFISSIIAGIAAVVSIQSFGDTLKRNILAQAKDLVGADFLVESRRQPSSRLLQIIDSLPGEKAKGYNFASMVSFPSKNKSRLVNVRAIAGGFPFYGNMTTHPSNAADEFRKGKCALVDATVMLQFDLIPGDSIYIGNKKLIIGGSVEKVPGQSGITAAVAPPVFMPFTELLNSDLLQKGSRIQYEFYFRSSSELNLKTIKDRLDPLLEKEDARLETFETIGQKTIKSYDNFGMFLQIIAFTALILGCIGVASSVNIYAKEKAASVAILRCIGVSRARSLLIFLMEIGMVGFIGSFIGSLFGVMIQQFFPILVQDFLPFSVQVSFSPYLFFYGILLGTMMSFLFSLIPLLPIWNVSPLDVFRNNETRIIKNTIWNAVVVSFILLFIYFFAWFQMGNFKFALYFSVGILVVFASLSGLTTLVLNTVKNRIPLPRNFIVRQSLLNLYRPNNQTFVLVLAIGMSVFLISTLYFTKELIQKKISLEGSAQDPNIILFDIRNEQLDDVANTLSKSKFPVLNKVPVVSIRLHSIRGRSVQQIKKDSTSGVKEWLLNREYRVTFRNQLTASENLVEGKWIGSISEGNTIFPVSIEKGMANDMKASVGDELVFDVQGLLVKTKIASIREVDWQRVQTNFLVVFPTGVLENAPQFHVITTRADTDNSAAKLQQMLVNLFPNISVVDIRQVLSLVKDIINKISSVIAFMAFFTLLTGIIVLIGAIRVSKNQRIKEGVLLRTLGAHKNQILSMLGIEYFFLGAFASIVGLLLSTISLYLIGHFSFKTFYLPPFGAILVLFILVTLLCVGIGMLNSRSVVNSPPLEVLRKEVN